MSQITLLHTTEKPVGNKNVFQVFLAECSFKNYFSFDNKDFQKDLHFVLDQSHCFHCKLK